MLTQHVACNHPLNSKLCKHFNASNALSSSMIFSALLCNNASEKSQSFEALLLRNMIPLIFEIIKHSIFWSSCLFSKQCSNSKFVDMMSTSIVENFMAKCLLQHIPQYKASDGEVGEATFQKLCKHSWYLTEENVVFVLFSCSAAVSNETKAKNC